MLDIKYFFMIDIHIFLPVYNICRVFSNCWKPKYKNIWKPFLILICLLQFVKNYFFLVPKLGVYRIEKDVFFQFCCLSVKVLSNSCLLVKNKTSRITFHGQSDTLMNSPRILTCRRCPPTTSIVVVTHLGLKYMFFNQERLFLFHVKSK